MQPLFCSLYTNVQKIRRTIGNFSVSYIRRISQAIWILRDKLQECAACSQGQDKLYGCYEAGTFSESGGGWGGSVYGIVHL